MKRFSAIILLVVMLLSLSACARLTNSASPLKWNGHGLDGLTFSERQAGGITFHYADPTTPAAIDGMGIAVARSLGMTRKYGRLAAGEAVQVWVVPAGVPWPAKLAPPPPGRRARAGAPLAVVLAEGGALDDSGLTQAVALAATQAAASPAYTVDWLHEGMGSVLSQEPDDYPGKVMQLTYTVIHKPEDMLKALTASPQTGDKAYAFAARSLATLVMDRWGVTWPDQYPRKAADLTPAKALLWATGAATQTDALALWQKRVSKTTIFTKSMADISPVRVQPKLRALPPGPGPNDNYSPQSYTISARYEPEGRLVTGDETLTWKNGETIAVDTLYFSLYPNAEQYAKYGAAMTVASVTVDGKPAHYTAQALDLTVPLGRSVAAGQQVAVRIQFTTRLPDRIPQRVLGQDDLGRFNLAHWFPMLGVLDDRGWNLEPLPEGPGEPYSENAQFHVSLNVPENTVLVATGHQRSRTAANGRWLYDYEAPNVKDFVVAGGTRLTETVRQAGPVTIHVLDANPDTARQLGEETERALKLFEAEFGPYAYSDIAVVPWSVGLEYPQLVYTEPPSTLLHGNLWHTRLYHELAHQWFYGMVGNDQYGEAWLDEGFATYAERFAVRTFGYADQLQDYSQLKAPPAVRVSSPAMDFNIYGGYAVGVYSLGGLLLEDLARLMGQDRFRQLLQDWTATYQFKTATTADFIRMAQAAAGQDLSQFCKEHRLSLSDRTAYRPVMPLGVVWPE